MYGSHIFSGDVDNAYKKGMQYAVDHELINKLGWQFSNIGLMPVQGVKSAVEILVSGKGGQPITGAVVTAAITRATKISDITYLDFKETGDGHYRGDFTPPFYGFYQVAATITAQGSSVPFKFIIYAAKKGEK